ncbi:CHAT domain-containing protein [Amycolatopsis sp. MEPSY49]|uniref:CHAT domain-containing protein n=1 Tax=Amycolatopsis sp. MEPSY49 TaxID=3151600 RepID=UPI003EF72EBC
MAELPCRLEFLSDDEVQYQDWAQREASGEIDRSGLLWRTTEWLCSYLEDRGDACKRTEIELLGRHLYELAFDASQRQGRNAVRECFEASFEAFDKLRDEQTTRLRIELVFHQKAELLSQLPWEFLFKPGTSGTGVFLAGRSRLVLTRHVPEHTPSNGGPARKVHILAAHCQPDGQNEIKSGEVVLAALRDLEATGSVVVDEAANPTYEQLRDQYARVRPQLLHLVAHGEEGGVLMQRPPEEIERDISLWKAAKRAGQDPEPVRTSRTVSADDLIAMFGEDAPELVFLQACKGGARTRQGMFTTAQRLVHGRVAAVVAMQYAIVDLDAQLFADRFYRTIADGRSIGDAVTAGRRALGQRADHAVHWDDPAFGTPVLYLQRDSDSPLVLKPENELAVPPAVASPNRVVPPTPSKCSRCTTLTTEYFCIECGYPVHCRSCGEHIAGPAKFCGQCGNRIQHAADRAERSVASNSPMRTGKDKLL